MDTVIVIILWLIILYQAIEKFLDRKQRIKREEELLNRIMARNYAEYAMIEVKKKEEKPEDQTEKYEQGIPIY